MAHIENLPPGRFWVSLKEFIDKEKCEQSQNEKG